MNNCQSCQDRAEERNNKKFYCSECGKQMTKITKTTKYCRECGRAYVEYSIECPKRNSFWTKYFTWNFHDRAFLKYKNLPRRE